MLTCISDQLVHVLKMLSDEGNVSVMNGITVYFHQTNYLESVENKCQ